jgi:catechol 2,3-dioxygenase-like lactoylglutathione lyase family enzyme
MTGGRPAEGGVTGFWHAGITVRDLDASLVFYRDGLGLELISASAASPAAAQVWDLPAARADVVYLRVPGSAATLELLQFHGAQQRDASVRPWDIAHGHFCLYVTGLDALHERLSALGFRARSAAVVEIGEGSLAGAKVVYMIDPDGYHVELFELPPA